MAKKSRNAAPPPFLAGPQRLNKVLAAAGLGARRQVEELIEQGRVEVDGKVVSEFHVKVDPAVSKISVDGQSLRKQRPVYFAVNKPAGVLCTNRDPEGRPRVIDLVPDSARLFPVGRLDRSSVGLILLTNDGELSQRLAHPKYGVDKTYFVVVQGQIGNDQLARLRRGIYLAEGVARVEGAKIRRFRKGCTELEICLTEGKNREIRRVLARLGHKVMVLRRLGIGPLRLANLAEGMYRPLTNEEVAALYAAAERARIARRDQKKGRNSTKTDEPGKSSDSKAAKVGTKGTRKPKKSKPDDEEILNDIEQSLMDVDDWNEDDDLVLPVDGVSGFEEEESDDFDEELDDDSIVEVSPVWNEQETYSQSEGGVIEYDDEEAEAAGLMRPARKRRDEREGTEDRPRKTGRKVGRKPIRGSRNQERGEGDRTSRDRSEGSAPRKFSKGARPEGFSKTGKRSSARPAFKKSSKGVKGSRGFKGSRSGSAPSRSSEGPRSSSRPAGKGKSFARGGPASKGRSGGPAGSSGGKSAQGRSSSSRPSKGGRGRKGFKGGGGPSRKGKGSGR